MTGVFAFRLGIRLFTGLHFHVVSLFSGIHFYYIHNEVVKAGPDHS